MAEMRYDRRAKEQGGSSSISGREQDASGALAVKERMEKANLGGGSIDSSVPKPDRSKYPAGLGGEAEYQNAYRLYQRKALKPKEAGQKRALGSM